jgi:hypothetical protein
MGQTSKNRLARNISFSPKDNDVFEKLKEEAECECRTLSGQIMYILKKHFGKIDVVESEINDEY